jgi:alkyl sulfatase BDS1-like metallo-beta-lactamase superfamily hydrolase
MMKQRFIKRAGFIDDWMDYLTHTAHDEAARLVPALGGRDAVMAQERPAISNDPLWAARLATYLILTNNDDREARQLRQQASIRYAQVTTSTNQRNYLLGLVAEENGDVDFDALLRGPLAGSLQRLQASELLRRLGSRLIAERADHIDTTIRLTLDGTETFDLSIINNVLRVSWPDDERPVMSEWSTDRATLIGALTHQFTLVQALENRSIRVSRNSQGSNQFASLFE